MFRIPHFLGLNDLICNLEIYVGRILGNLGYRKSSTLSCEALYDSITYFHG